MFSSEKKLEVTESKKESLSYIADHVENLHAVFKEGITRSFKFRETQLLGLMRFMEEYESAIKAALYEDLRKPAQEAFMVEIAIVKREIRETLRHLSSWMSPKKVSTFFAAQPATSFVQADPLGVVLIIAPWNYPVQLALMPLIGAIAAGNCAIVKPSEFAPRTSHLLATFLPKYLDRKCFQVIEGAIPETSALLAEKFDHIFFTGSPNVGKIVALAAAKNLTPTTLELGGKSPCIVDDSANLAVAAERIVWGKFSNAGQTCIAPDYVLVDKDVEEKLLFYIKEKIKEFYGANPKESKDFGRIVNKQHYDRLLKILSENGDIFLGGEACEGERYIAPTVLKNVSASYSIMDKDTEIFGPILPVVTFDKVGDVISFVNSRPKPLTIYLFSENPQMVELVRKNTSSGSLVVNHTLLQGGVLTLPFGGVGESGMGAYHGKKSFDTFSHQKAVFNKTTHWNLFDVSSYVIYPPYSGTKETLLRLTI